MHLYMWILLCLNIQYIWSYEETELLPRCNRNSARGPEMECSLFDVWRSSALTGSHAEQECRDICSRRCRRIYGRYSHNQCVREGSEINYMDNSYLCQCKKCDYCPTWL